MADINIPPEMYVSMAESTNKSGVAHRWIKHRATSNPIQSSNLVATAIFEIATGNGEYLDLFSIQQNLHFTTASTTDNARIDDLGTCIWDRAVLFINGRQIAYSNNFTQDAIVSRRLQFSKSYNESVNNMQYRTAVYAAAAATTFADGTYSDVSYLMDGLMLRAPSGCWVPPNSNVRIELYPAASNGLYKALSGDGADTAVTLTINDLYLTVQSFISDEVSPQHFMKFVTMDSFKALVDAATFNKQVSVRDNLVRVAAVLNDSTSETATATIIYNLPKFVYATDGASVADATDRLNTLQFKVGNAMLPPERFDNTTYKFYDAYQQFIVSTGKHMDPAGGETYDVWRFNGPIYTVPVIKQPGDIVKQIEVQATFAAQPTAYMTILTFHEQIVRFAYENGVPKDMELAI